MCMLNLIWQLIMYYTLYGMEYKKLQQFENYHW